MSSCLTPFGKIFNDDGGGGGSGGKGGGDRGGQRLVNALGQF